jgi:serine/threonine protein kinase
MSTELWRGGPLAGRLQRTAVLGKGGVGVVHRAQDFAPGGEVALKVLDTTPSSSNRQPSIQEGRLAASC